MPILGWFALAALTATGGLRAQPSPEVPVPAQTRTIKEQRAFYNVVQNQKGRATACDGGPPVFYRSRHTASDVTAAIFTLGLWTPTHIDVICPARVAAPGR
jgi:hypothetical protein